MPLSVQVLLLVVSSLYQAIACWREDRKAPPGQRLDVGGYRLHLYSTGEASPRGTPTLVIDHSLGGIEGYLLLEHLAPLGRVYAYDRAGYGWSDRSPYPRTSDRIVTELDTLLTQAQVNPPYILIGDSFGSYNVRLYAHRYPDKVAGLILTDGLHEAGMLKMPLSLQALKLFFISGFLMSTLGSAVGILQILRTLGLFEQLKPELRKFSKPVLDPVKRSFCRPKHWITMTQEMLQLENSARQVRIAADLGTIPIVSIKAASFFQPSIWTTLVPLKQANELREQMHTELSHLSTNVIQLPAPKSGHFVWVDQPDVIVNAVQMIREQIASSPTHPQPPDL